MQIRSVHNETISFLITDCPKHNIILGKPWLRQHDPHMSWVDQEILTWSEYCKNNCLTKPILQSAFSSVECPDAPDMTKIPGEYKDFLDVFS